MNREFVPYELAVKLKQLGFDEQCISHYTAYGKFSNDYSAPRKYNSEFELGSYISAPTLSQAFRWFREKHNLISIITTIPSFHTMYASKYKSHTYYQFQPFKWVDGKYLINDTYEEAELACLDKLIKIVETKQQEQ